MSIVWGTPHQTAAAGAQERLVGSAHAPYAHGRLVITPLGNGRFAAEVTRRADKWATGT